MSGSNLIHAVIIDDEENIVSLISELIREYCPQIEIVGTANNVESGIICIEDKRPDLVFLDIAMPDGTGFNVIQALSFKDFELVFITAYDSYAIKAFEFSAIHYILKPVNHTHLIEVVKRYNEKKQHGDLENRIRLLSQNLRDTEKRILLTSLKETKIIKINDIIYCESSNNYTSFYLIDDSKIVVSKPLNTYYRMLSDFDFFRIHSTTMVNLKYIKSYVKGRGGYVVMQNGAELDVAVRKKNQFMHVVEEYLLRIE